MDCHEVSRNCPHLYLGGPQVANSVAAGHEWLVTPEIEIISF
jgi:hypothetical protein